jgi:hypothetical protein
MRPTKRSQTASIERGNKRWGRRLGHGESFEMVLNLEGFPFRELFLPSRYEYHI